MYRLTEDLPHVSLALSLHAPNQIVRVKIVPTAGAYKFESLMAAMDNHIKKNKDDRKFKKSVIGGAMLEYILIRGVNDRPEHAHELGRLLMSRRENVYLNLIPYNKTEVAEDFDSPTEEEVKTFFAIVTSEPYNIWTRVRQQMGDDISGACGQLAVTSGRRQQKDMDMEDLATPASAIAARAKHVQDTKIRNTVKHICFVDVF